MFSIVLATRSGITEFSGPLKLLQDMSNKMHSAENFEIIIRGDDDDEKFPNFINLIKKHQFAFKVKTISGSRSRGYEDLHKFYNECFIEASSKSEFIFSLPEDVNIAFQDWDKFLIDEFNLAKKTFNHQVFTMHQSLLGSHCGYDNCLEAPDPFPIYSKDWICSLSGFSHTGANDSWIQAINHFLIKDYGIISQHFLSKTVFKRNTDSHDSVASPRWSNARLRNHELMRKKRVKKIIKTQAEILYNLICDKKSEPSKLEYANYLCDHHGAGAVLPKIYFFYIRSKAPESIQICKQKIEELLNKMLILKNVIPCTNDKTKFLQTPSDGKTSNLNKTFFSNEANYDHNENKQLVKSLTKKYGYFKSLILILKNIAKMIDKTS